MTIVVCFATQGMKKQAFIFSFRAPSAKTVGILWTSTGILTLHHWTWSSMQEHLSTTAFSEKFSSWPVGLYGQPETPSFSIMDAMTSTYGEGNSKKNWDWCAPNPKDQSNVDLISGGIALISNFFLLLWFGARPPCTFVYL